MDTFGSAILSFIERLSSLWRLKRTSIIEKGPQKLFFIFIWGFVHSFLLLGGAYDINKLFFFLFSCPPPPPPPSPPSSLKRSYARRSLFQSRAGEKDSTQISLWT